MPRVSSFFGITIAMFYNDHRPAHFHAYYAEHEATVTIDSLEVLSGILPRRALALVLEWASLRHYELRADWERSRAGLPLEPIEPLD